ncbi:hypothetical protein DPMN_002239 [Dreissena polymorpha]|uniref:Integrase zinc-binding domain-containing protein n=1 Tax=Dreissena polymorpha TaxID=45954 RepID=A0A9D4MMR7_DREPO|nr:hypothetical protein DPMN_002239 [Dreissena polymorpha]
MSYQKIQGGHQIVKRTKANIAKFYYWYDLKTDVKVYVQQCDVCETNKKNTTNLALQWVI